MEPMHIEVDIVYEEAFANGCVSVLICLYVESTNWKLKIRGELMVKIGRHEGMCALLR